MQKKVDFSIESLSPTDRTKFLDVIREIDGALSRIDSEKALIKAAIETVFKETAAPKKLVRKMAKTYHKDSFDIDKDENNEFEALYETVCK